MLVKNKFEIYILKYFKCKNNYTFDDLFKCKKIYTFKYLLYKKSYTFSHEIKL